MKRTMAATACLTILTAISLTGSIALAQDSSRNLPPRPLRAAQQPQQAQDAAAAPVGHRQPHAGDVPSETGDNDPAKIDAQDRELDRMIKGICKGC